MEREEILNSLNKDQQEAVLKTEGPVLILAGAGSGKTRVLVHRIAYLIDVCGVLPGNILAITFTNKAAKEMRERVDKIIGFGASEIWVSTFHSTCVRILRRNAELLGFTRYFTIYDTDDQLTLMKQIFKKKNIDTKRMKEKTILHAISQAKDELLTPEKYRIVNGNDYWAEQVAELYEEYQSELKANNAMDFDDLIVKTVELFKKNPDVLMYYQERFKYLMIDEYQDTNTAQFEFVSLLAKQYRNLCVVGDDDQSIYKFRGANIGNILGFEKVFPDAGVVRLQQNYRSTKNILNAANEVIAHNKGRKKKHLWTENDEGDMVRFRRFSNGFEEADFVANEIFSLVRRGNYTYKECAVLYRTNAQSRLFEEKFLYNNIPYRIVGGINFYARKEIKDILAYLKTVDNGVDDLAVRRIINVPKRGIGQTTINKIAEYAEAGGISFFDGALEAEEMGSLSKAAEKKIEAFTDFIGVLRVKSETLSVSELIKEIADKTGYREELEKENTDESESRLENIDELISKAVQYETSTEEPSLSGFLEEVALIADIDSVDESDDRVLLMTLHSAKGLEFPVVYMAGMEEGLFPSSMSINAEDAGAEIEEERRLAYVGMTRAKQHLTLTYARERMVRGEVQSSPISRFVREIPRDMVDTAADDSRTKTYSFEPRGTNSAIKNAFSAKAYAPKPSGYTSGYERGKNSGSWGKFGAAAPKPASQLVKETPDYNVGDMVHHKKFGDGVVKNIRDGGRDYEVTVDFESWGVKKMFASFAKLQKI